MLLECSRALYGLSIDIINENGQRTMQEDNCDTQLTKTVANESNRVAHESFT